MEDGKGDKELSSIIGGHYNFLSMLERLVESVNPKNHVGNGKEYSTNPG